MYNKKLCHHLFTVVEKQPPISLAVTDTILLFMFIVEVPGMSMTWGAGQCQKVYVYIYYRVDWISKGVGHTEAEILRLAE